MRRELVYSNAFGRALRKWLKTHPETADDVQATLTKLREDSTQLVLHTHKLKGQFADCWACSAGYDLRSSFST